MRFLVFGKRELYPRRISSLEDELIKNIDHSEEEVVFIDPKIEHLARVFDLDLTKSENEQRSEPLPEKTVRYFNQ